VKVAVLVKQVPDTESKFEILPDGKGIDESKVKWVINPHDEYAVEQAIQVKEAVGGEVIAFTLGPDRSEEAIRQAYALGVDRGMRIDPGSAELDPFAIAKTLAGAIRDEGCDIILAGKQAADDNAGFVHIGIAEDLDWPHVSPVEEFELMDDARKVCVTRPAAGSVKEIVEVELPAVIGCEKGLNEPRYPTLPAIMKAKKKPIEVYPASKWIGDSPVKTTIKNYRLAPQREGARILKGTAAEAAEQLVSLLRTEAKII
jgi:electron transfer flavoprotein beta subunit